VSSTLPLTPGNTGPAAHPAAAAPGLAGAEADAGHPPFVDTDATAAELEAILSSRPSLPRWIGWRLRLLLLSVLAGCAGVFLLAYLLAEQPRIDATWKASPDGEIRLSASNDPLLREHIGQALDSVTLPQGRTLMADPVMLQRSPRWISDDGQRRLQRELRGEIAHSLTGHPASDARVTLHFATGKPVAVAVQPHGYGSLPPQFWILAGLALVLFLVGMVVLLAAPGWRNALYALMSMCQSGNLIFIALESAMGVGAPVGFPLWDWNLRTVFDLITAAAMAHLALTHPRKLPADLLWKLLIWGSALLICGIATRTDTPYAWWIVQAGCAALGLVAVGLMTWSSRRIPHPFTLVLRRFTVVTVGTWALLTASVAASASRPELQHGITTVGSMIWYVFLASLLLLVPYLSRSQQVLREFSLLAATSTVATSLDLLFVAAFSLGQFASITLALTLSLGAYLAARQWIMSHLLGSSRLTMERLFERLYRMARELQSEPQRTTAALTRLLRELFEPLEVAQLNHPVNHSVILGNGSALLVPLGRLRDLQEGAASSSLLVRYAHRGQRLFTSEDARLTDRIVEQLHRAVSFDQAVEQGRCEERMRIAQDLHDDIGARLLTLMYQAPTPELEDYIRHTLQDLKTLTRGLATQNHSLSDAAAEWKADLGHRLALAHVHLRWDLDFDQDIELTMVQWSALTRVLRELVSNVIAHAQATEARVGIRLHEDRLELTIADNGRGGDPQAWNHGLGLGGVRKRVKQMGGTVRWEANEPRGIACRVVVEQWSAQG
jgi:signal transduction histidine kinase